MFTVIPTKELVYAPRVRHEGLAAPEVYRRLVVSEERLVSTFAESLAAFPGARYVDLVSPLQRAAMTAMLYPGDENGQPIAGGYDLIARVLAPAVAEGLPEAPEGLVFLGSGADAPDPVLVIDGAYWVFSSVEIMRANGWTSQLPYSVVPRRDIAGLRYAGLITTVDPGRFGPAVLSPEAP